MSWPAACSTDHVKTKASASKNGAWDVLVLESRSITVISLVRSMSQRLAGAVVVTGSPRCRRRVRHRRGRRIRGTPGGWDQSLGWVPAVGGGRSVRPLKNWASGRRCLGPVLAVCPCPVRGTGSGRHTLPWGHLLGTSTTKGGVGCVGVLVSGAAKPHETNTTNTLSGGGTGRVETAFHLAESPGLDSPG
jgi:hypothetical protein